MYMIQTPDIKETRGADGFLIEAESVYHVLVSALQQRGSVILFLYSFTYSFPV